MGYEKSWRCDVLGKYFGRMTKWTDSFEGYNERVLSSPCASCRECLSECDLYPKDMYILGLDHVLAAINSWYLIISLKGKI